MPYAPPCPRPSAARALRGATLAVLIAGGVAVGGATPAHADLEARVADRRAAAEALERRVADQRGRIARTTSGLRDAEARLSRLEATAARREAQLTSTRDRLVAMRARLARLEARQAEGERILRANVRAHYETERPDVMSVVLSSGGFAELLDRVDFYRRVSERNTDVLRLVRGVRREVAGQTRALKAEAERFQRLAAAAEERRDEADVLRAELARRRAAQLSTQRERTAALSRVRDRLDGLERRLTRRRAAERRRVADARSGGGQIPAGGANAAVRKIRSAGNEIARMPYQYGGGHGGGKSSGYDCSGSISYALAAAGLLEGSLTSGGFMSWGDAGEGEHVTIYANAGHAFMVVDGWRFDTSALRQGGTRWTRQTRSTAGFTARHPPGL